MALCKEGCGRIARSRAGAARTIASGGLASRSTPRFVATSDTKKAQTGRSPPSRPLRRLRNASVRSRLRRNSLCCAS